MQIPGNNDDTKSSVYESDPGDIEAAVGGYPTVKTNEFLTKPHSVLQNNKIRSPLGSFKGSFKSIAQSKGHNIESDTEEKGSLQSLITEKGNYELLLINLKIDIFINSLITEIKNCLFYFG